MPLRYIRRSMPAKLTNQDKLALALTSAGSMRNLGALVGVTHQKIGRWLRGDTPIPREATKAINLAFKIHSEVARDQAAVEGLPFDPQTPVFITRPDLIKKVPVVVGMNANGTPKIRIRPKAFPGQRAIVSKSDYMSPDLVARAVEPLMRSPLFGAVTARSVIKAKDAIKQRVSGFQSLLKQLDDRELAPNDPIRRYTDYSNKTRFSPPDEVAADLQAKLEQRAQYALTPADSVVFFMPRTDDERPIIKKRKRSRR